MEKTFDDMIVAALSKVNIPVHELKYKQRDIFIRQDVFISLPTGFEKSIPHQMYQI